MLVNVYVCVCACRGDKYVTQSQLSSTKGSHTDKKSHPLRGHRDLR